ncbi:MAG: radical SAM protein [Clostridia bacterium]|nr:radical SAM protein [Clostridia bacterium]
MKIYNKGFNYSQDGPGNRLVYHLQGCNFRCRWCSNPESMEASGECREYSVEELLKEAQSCVPMFFDGGGVTLTGGEPTMQFDEIKEFLSFLRKSGIHTAIENNGSHPRLRELFDVIDFLIMDVKHFDEEQHRFWTGVSNKNTVENLKIICETGRQALIRIPLINGVNNDAEGFVRLFNSFNCSGVYFEILPYHEFGRDKWTVPYEIENGFVESRDIKNFEKLFRENGLRIIKT